MALHLPKELETSIAGDNRHIIIKQVDEFREEVTIYLTVHQFDTIFNFSKSLVKEALEIE